MKKRLLALVVVLTVAGANFAQAGFSAVEKLFKKKPPLYFVFERIARLTYRENVMDCSNKASLYVNILCAAGVDARVLVVKNFGKYGAAPHCLVLIADYDVSGQSVVCDPTADEWYFGADVAKLGEYVRMLRGDELSTNREFSFRQSLLDKLKRLTHVLAVQRGPQMALRR